MKTRLPRHEIETMCIFLALRDGACSTEILATRLGLAIALAQPLRTCIEPFTRDGRIVAVGTALSLSTRGREWLRTRLDDVGLA